MKQLNNYVKDGIKITIILAGVLAVFKVLLELLIYFLI